tara:strand:- start:885 stop:1583 length:699 start_codon:yes stop_codon:yes gene_type:complete
MRESFFFILLLTSFTIDSQELKLDFFGESIVQPFNFVTSDSLAIISAPKYTSEFISELEAIKYYGFGWIESQTDEKVYFAGKVVDHQYVEELRSLIYYTENEYVRRSAENALNIILKEIDKVILRNAKYGEDFYFELYPDKLEDLLSMNVEYSWAYNSDGLKFLDDCNNITKEILSHEEVIYKELNEKNLKEIQSYLGTEKDYFKLKLTCISEDKKSPWVFLVKNPNQIFQY